MPSTPSGSDERAPPLPERRAQPSVHQFIRTSRFGYYSSLHYFPPFSTASALLNTESSNNAHIRAYPNMTSDSSSPFEISRSTIAVSNTSSPEQSPIRMGLDLPSGDTARGRFPPTHPDRQPHHLQYQHHPSSHAHAHSQSYSDLFAGSNLDFRDPPPEQHATNVNESFESICGPSNSSPFTNPTAPSSPQTVPIPNCSSHSKSLHQPSPPVPPVPRSLGCKRPESVQAFRASDIGDGKELTGPPNWNNNANSRSISHRTNSQNIHHRSLLSISTTPSLSVNHSGNWPPTPPHRQTQFGLSPSSSLTVTLSMAGPLPRPPSSTSSTTTMTQNLTRLQLEFKLC